MHIRIITPPTRRCLLAAVIAQAALLAAAHASLISPVSATTNMGSGFSTSLTNTINGVGLSSLSLTAEHTETLDENSWVSQAGILTGKITFDLGALVLIDGFSFWNQNNGGPGALGSTGIKGVQIGYSTNNITFNPLLGAPTVFAQATGNTSFAQQFTFPPVIAEFVQFTVLSDYGDVNYTGFAEIQFSRVPEPGTVLTGVLGAGVCFIGLLSRSRRSAARQ